MPVANTSQRFDSNTASDFSNPNRYINIMFWYYSVKNGSLAVTRT